MALVPAAWALWAAASVAVRTSTTWAATPLTFAVTLGQRLVDPPDLGGRLGLALLELLPDELLGRAAAHRHRRTSATGKHSPIAASFSPPPRSSRSPPRAPAASRGRHPEPGPVTSPRGPSETPKLGGTPRNPANLSKGWARAKWRTASPAGGSGPVRTGGAARGPVRGKEILLGKSCRSGRPDPPVAASISAPRPLRPGGAARISTRVPGRPRATNSRTRPPRVARRL